MSDPDFIVVGAGTAGSILAGRLTEGDRHRVMLVEAGGKPSNQFVSIPAGFARLFKSSVDWAFESEPQMHRGRRVFTPRGKMLGGSSNINAQIHQWCHPADFDEWAAGGATGWSWADVAPTFIAQERWNGPATNGRRGTDGPMLVAPNVHANALSHAFVESAAACDITGPDDYNGGAFEGAWIVQVAHHRGRRFSAYDAYLKPAMARRSLETIAGTTVTRLIMDGGRCAGVAVLRDGQEREFRAARGVVLAAGAIGSPQLLLRSGIGPAVQLTELGIPVIRDVPGVGVGLQDHPVVVISFATSRRDTLKSADSPQNLLRYLLLKRGPLASNAIEAFSFSRIGSGESAPNLELLFAPLEWRNQGLEVPRIHAFSIGAIAVKPRSRGAITLRSADPLAAPRIDFGLLTDPDGHDARVMLDGLRLARRVASTRPLSSTMTGELRTSRECRTDAEWLDFVADNIQTVYHPSSTCRMGNDEGAVVTPELKFRGIDGLWVADASVMPSVPRGHPNAVVAMIANRAAEWLRRG